MKVSLLRVAGLLAGASALPFCHAADSAAALREGFNAPPMATRPVVRWWWFGPAVVKPELEREMTLMRDGGFSGFEVQPTYPLALDGEYPGLKNFKFLSPEFFEDLRFTAEKAKEIGLRMDLTLGSGWPYGGPMFSRVEAAQSITEAGVVIVSPGQTTVEAPPEKGHGAIANAPVIAALLGPVKDAPACASPYIPLEVKDRVAQLPTDMHGATAVHFYDYAQARLMYVKRAAYGAEGFIIDHYNASVVDKFIHDIATPEINACGPNVPYSIFCDSLETEGEGWTPAFPEYFRQHKGYDLIPLLPALFDDTFPHAAEIRGDYGSAIAALFDEAFVDRFTALAKEHHTKFRIQAYGTPPTTLSTYARADLDEGENYNWRLFSGTRWAASASHVLGRTVTSAESMTWLHSPVFMAAPIDIKAESNLQFLNGVNHLLFHGWPYTAPAVEYPGWRFYAAGVFNEKNPWWIVMPDITRYLARTSYLLQQGAPVNDVAIYLPEEDAFSEMTPHDLQMVQAGGNGLLNRLVNPIVPPILDAGFNFDGIDAGVLASRGRVEGGALAFGDMRYRAVVLPHMTYITPTSLQTLEQFANAGGIVIAVDAPPSAAPGYRPGEAANKTVQQIVARLFTGPNAKGTVVPRDELAATLRAKLTPDVTMVQPNPALGVVHRHAGDTDYYFVANTTNEPVSTDAQFRATGKNVTWWDPTTGRVTAANATAAPTTTRVKLVLAPYEARFLVFAGATGEVSESDSGAPAQSLDLSRDWHVTFKNSASEANPTPTTFAQLASWTDLPATHYFSGIGTYTKQIDVPAVFLAAGPMQALDFGPGEAAKVAGGPMGMRADFQPPIGDAAIVYVNGQRAGALWCPPYRVDVSGLLHAGQNEIRVEVASRASNYMADTAHHPEPDYRALNANHELGGRRFDPQDMRSITVTPSGLLGPIHLLALPRG